MKKIFTLFTLIGFNSYSQTPSISPAFFSPEDDITISYDVSGTSLQNLQEAWIWMWLPDKGVDAPSNINPASTNSSATNAAKFERTVNSMGRVIFSITLKPTSFYGVSADQIESIGMLLKGNNWSDGQSDDHVATVSNGFSLILESPSSNFGFFETSQDITISGQTSETADIEISVDNVSVFSFSEVTQFSTSHSIISDGQVHDVVVVATNGTETSQKKYSYTITPTPIIEAVPSGARNGINYASSSSATLVLEAPNKEHVFVLCDLNDWSIDSNYLMKKDGDRFWITISTLESGVEYQFQYLVDGEIRIADPYSEKISSPFDDNEIILENRYPNLKPYPNKKTSEAVSFLQTDKSPFAWDAFERPEKEDLIIYELLIRDFTTERSYNAVIDKLDYLEDLGINALELMPVQEFEGNLSWGYNPAFMFAFDKYYGTELDLKTLINEAHKRGIAVILDIVLNHHFGQNSLVRLYNEGLYGNPTTENPWFNVSAKHDFNVGYDMNHESQSTKDYADRVIEYWIKEYNVDGYRFDLSKGFTQKNSLGNVGLWGSYDASRIAIWKRIADKIWSIDPATYIILEHFADNSEEKELADYGMMLWGNLNHTYINAGKGSSTSLSSVYHESRGWAQPNLVGYMESHDEERFMWSLTKSGKSTTEALERAKLSAAFFLTVPGPKMIWQFGEMGYDEELNNDRLGIKPTHWEYLDDPDRDRLFKLYKSLSNLRTKTNYIKDEYFTWDTSGRIKTINIQHPEVSIYVVGNFDTESQTGIHKFSQTGTWYDYFTGESIDVSGDEEFTFRSGQFKIYTSKLIENYIPDGPLTLSVNEHSNDEVTVYPNPAIDLIFIDNSERDFTHYSMTNITGKKIEVKKPLSKNAINISSLNNGIYILHLFDKSGSIQKTIVKK